MLEFRKLLWEGSITLERCLLRIHKLHEFNKDRKRPVDETDDESNDRAVSVADAESSDEQGISKEES